MNVCLEKVRCKAAVIVWITVLLSTLFPLSVANGVSGSSTHSQASAIASLPPTNKLIVGYWHNFDNGSGYVRLKDVSPKFDVINVAFAEPTNGPRGGTIGFTPYQITPAELKADVQYLQSLGKKVIISIGGANGQVQLETAQARDQFVSSMKSIITTYGFDGLDIDFEGHSLYLNNGDSDFRNPTTPVITNLISAIRELHTHFGDSFMITMAPETFFVQVGYSFYGGTGTGADPRAGAYLPVIHAVRDILDWLQVQHYNSGPITALDGTYYTMGNADFHVAMADMVLTGFPVARNNERFFAPLRADQVVIGLPANVNAGGGFTTVAEVHKALDYLYKGQTFGGRYVLRNPAGYANMRGLMTWSINWDRYNNFEFSTRHRTYLDALNVVPDTQAPSAPSQVRTTAVGTTSVGLAWQASTDNVAVIEYDIFEGANKVGSTASTSFTVQGLTPDTTYSFTVKAKDRAGNVSAASMAVTVKTGAIVPDPTPPTPPTNVVVSSTTASSIGLTWTPSTDNIGVTGYTVSYGTSQVNGTEANVTITGLAANMTYTFTIVAKDAAGNQSTGTTIQATTSQTPSASDWKAGVSYKVNDEATYAGKVYVCRQPHTSLLGWEPPNVPALWRLK
ncbi:fibronectin type III domain-containing protein [Paenibacillus arenosi]|uniref:chitinase n=1 Tax=Paenibacillus arenosi TaxID=2774142 RepID=A0ABR9AS45_9BACL|nr:glycosyl hydrolase family 18 protein [Paenibacillus arenosi]MBD8496691.1 fibronectin type III domain-containing protein [Paenibacillus arenosi]